MARPPGQQVLDFLTGYDSPVGNLALALREILLEELPDAVEKVYRNHPTAVWYGSGPKMRDMFCYIARAKAHVNLGFCRGALLPDPSEVLEGEGKVMRHVKFRNEQDIARPALVGPRNTDVRDLHGRSCDGQLAGHALALAQGRRALAEVLGEALGGPEVEDLGRLVVLIDRAKIGRAHV